MSKVYIDSETCGLHSMMVLLQYAEEDGPIRLHEVWRRPIRETLRLIEWLTEQTVVGFNLSFDWFHIAKTYTIFRLANPDWIPREHIDDIALLEPKGQDGPCVKPAAALDLMLHSRKGPYQSLMAREDIRIKRVPSALAYALASELEGRVQLDNIYFARSADPNAPKWQVFDRKDRYGDIDTDFKDVVLKFNPAGGLKFLAEHAMGFKPKYHFKDVEPPTAWRPYELGYAPTALAVSSPEKNWEVWGRKKGKQKIKVAVEEQLTDPALSLDDEHDDDEVVAKRGKPKAGEDALLGYAWPGVIDKHIEHWATRPDAREYANDDIVYTRALDKHFELPDAGRQRFHAGLHGAGGPLARLLHQHPRHEATVGQGRGHGGSQSGQHQQAGRSPRLRHGRDGPYRGDRPGGVHEEEQPGSHPQLGDCGRESRAAGAKARRAASAVAARASSSRASIRRPSGPSKSWT